MLKHVPDLSVTSRETTWRNVFTGTAEALVAAGLVESHQIPGQPTSGKTMASFMPDGSRVKQGSTSHCKTHGYKKIYKSGKVFVLEVVPSADELKKREVEAKHKQTVNQVAPRNAKLDKYLAGLEVVRETSDPYASKTNIDLLISRLQRIARQPGYRSLLQGFCRAELVEFDEALSRGIKSLNEEIEIAKMNTQTSIVKIPSYLRLVSAGVAVC